MFGLIFASAFFSASETALFFLSHDELRGMRVGNNRERLAADLMRRPERLLTAILFWNLLINLSYFATGIVVAGRLAAAGFAAAAGVVGVGSLLLIILFGEVLPKGGAVVFRRRLASLVSWPLAAAVRLLDPVTPGLSWMTHVLRRAFWPNLKLEPHLHADDLERAIDVSELSDEVIRHERQILHNILDLSEISVEEVMWPRGTYPSLPVPVSLTDLNNVGPECKYIAVQRPGTEDVERALPLMEFAELPETNLERSAEDVVTVPWCATLADTLQLLRDRFCGVACVVNEYGETVGIVTYEDIIDMCLTPAPSRARRMLQREPVLEIAPGVFQVEGITTLRYLCRRLEIEFEAAKAGIVTVSGLVSEELEQIPVVGDECGWRGWRFEVIESIQPGRMRVMVRRRR